MKNCAYCNIPIPRRKRKFWRHTCVMGGSEPVCDRCILEKQPELLVGFIGVNQ